MAKIIKKDKVVRIETTTTTCPVCKYQYQVKIYFFESVKSQKIIDDVLEEVVTKGSEKFIPFSEGSFCPNCGIFFNTKICTHTIKEKL